MSLLDLDWRELLVPTGSLLEVVVRGTLVYLSLFVLLRVVLKRESGRLGVTGLLMIVLIADAAQNAMAGEYRSVPEGLLLVGTIVFWAFVVDWIGFHVPRLQPLLRPHALPLVRDGRLLRRNMERELITEEELLSQLRLQGVEDLSEVKAAYMEGDGRISVIPYEPGNRGGSEQNPEA